MSDKIEFYFDFSSPYGYLGSQRIRKVAAKHNREVDWHPVLLGAIFKMNGQAPLTTIPLKGDYAMMDFQRTAREHSLAYQHPDKFPIATVAAARTAWWVKEHNDASIKNKTEDFIDAMFHAYYVDNQDISDANKVLELAGSVGLDKSAVEAALQDQAVKDRLKQAVEDAIELKIFGSPMMRVDGELFWGSDRIDQIDRWLSVGGW